MKSDHVRRQVAARPPERPAGRAAPPSPAAQLRSLQRTAGNAAVVRMLSRDPEDEKRFRYPWVGEIHGSWAAALRRTPRKPGGDPHANTIADLPRGASVRVVTRQGGWLRVEATVDGQVVEGYVSQELVRYVRESAFVVDDPIVVTVDLPTVAEAFVELKRAETRTAQGARLSQDEVNRLELAASVLEATTKYVVDQSTWVVDFAQKGGEKTFVATIEDFILFVERVERAYPHAKPAAVVSEVRQTWFADPRWAVLVASQGIRTRSGRLVDIETEAPIATSFDMRRIAPNRKGGDEQGLKLATRMGVVDMSHVMAGLDAVLSGSPSSYPEGYLEELEERSPDDYDTYANTAVYEALRSASGGDVRDFATWSGDLGQVYAHYLADRYLKNNDKATLAGWTAAKMPRAQLLGDIHGYVIKEAWRRTSNSPTGGDDRISSVLRDMYLVDKPGWTYSQLLEHVSGKPASELRRFITARTIAFARLWFAKESYAHDGDDAWTAGGTIEMHAEKFDRLHKQHEASAAASERLGTLVDQLLTELGGSVR